MEPVRLHKLLAGWGVASRRAVEAMIQAGRIRVEGEVFTDPGQRVSPTSHIEVDGRPVRPPPTAANPVVLAFHKPPGVLSSLADQFGRSTLKDFFAGPHRLYPIGRLDADSTGLLLMTNHGELTNRLLHPRYKVEKEYRVHVSGEPLTPDECQRFAQGLELEDGLTAPCRISLTSSGDCQVVLREGRKRQIKRMFATLGRQVTRLHRVRFGPIRLGTLPAGEARRLSPDELTSLLTAAGLPAPALPGERPCLPR